jgi:hypothetical protein
MKEYSMKVEYTLKRKLSFFGLLVCILTSSTGCENLPKKDYEDYKKRTVQWRQIQERNIVESKLADIRGVWLINARLSAGIPLGLKVEFVAPGLSADQPLPTDDQGNFQLPIELEARIWLERTDHTQDKELVVVNPPPSINAEGQFSMVADPLILDSDSLGVSGSEVEAVVTLNSRIISDQIICGDALGNVVNPINIDLQGSTFSAVRWKEGLLSTDLPNRCPEEEDENGDIGGNMGGNMGGNLGGNMGGNMGGLPNETQRPDSPNLDSVQGEALDITGHWLMNVQLSAGIPLKLWASLIYTATETGGYLDGVLRRETGLVSETPIALFSAEVDADGRFEVWLPQFTLTSPLPIEGDLLLSGVILPPNESGDQTVAWCGAAAGQTRLPTEIDLTGTTFYSHPWVPGTPAPDPLFTQCPLNQDP